MAKMFHSLVTKWNILPSFPWKVCSARVNFKTIVTRVLNFEHHLVHVYIMLSNFTNWLVYNNHRALLLCFPKKCSYIATIPHYVNLFYAFDPLFMTLSYEPCGGATKRTWVLRYWSIHFFQDPEWPHFEYALYLSSNGITETITSCINTWSLLYCSPI